MYVDLSPSCLLCLLFHSPKNSNQSTESPSQLSTPKEGKDPEGAMGNGGSRTVSEGSPGGVRGADPPEQSSISPMQKKLAAVRKLLSPRRTSKPPPSPETVAGTDGQVTDTGSTSNVDFPRGTDDSKVALLIDLAAHQKVTNKNFEDQMIVHNGQMRFMQEHCTSAMDNSVVALKEVADVRKRQVVMENRQVVTEKKVSILESSVRKIRKSLGNLRGIRLSLDSTNSKRSDEEEVGTLYLIHYFQ